MSLILSLDEMSNIDEYIYDLFVINGEGLCLFHKNFGKSTFEVDGVIISGFLSAIETFSQSVDKGMRMLVTKNFRFIYYRSNSLIYICRTPKSVENNIAYNTLKFISLKMNKILPPDYKFDGNVTHFQILSDFIDEYFNSNTKVVSLNSEFEISGNRSSIHNTTESKIYSYLRLRGRQNLSKIVQILKLDEDEALKASRKLLDKGIISIHESFRFQSAPQQTQLQNIHEPSKHNF